jgi:hypothetical protein
MILTFPHAQDFEGALAEVWMVVGSARVGGTEAQ